MTSSPARELELRCAAGPWTSVELDHYVQLCDQLGGIASPACRAAVSGFRYRPTVEIDVSLDPFSEDYFDQQVSLYLELSGRSQVDQDKGEITPIDVDIHAAGANPYASTDINFMSRHVRAVMTTIYIANLPHGARVLDLGAGWGLTSEMLAYAGARVQAVDINPLFVELIKRRVARTGLPIEASQGNFDQFAFEVNAFDLVLFYECLHHAQKPWETLERIRSALKPGGLVAFAGEPINAVWWPHWGMRLDQESVYVMRKFGWFENGLSSDFIRQCFLRAGLEPTFLKGVGLDGGDICFAQRSDDDIQHRLNAPPS